MEIEQRFGDVAGQPTRYLTAGSGPALVLLHAAGESAADWQWIIPMLARAHRVYAPDLYPGEHRPAAASYSPAFFSHFVATFLTTLGVERAAVIGNSLGGLSALHLALTSPARVTALGLIASAGLGSAVHPALIISVAPVYADLAVNWCKWPLGALQRVGARIPLLFTHPERIPQAWYKEQYRLAQRPYFLDAVLASLRAQINPGGQRVVVLDQLARLEMPTLILWGEDDQIFPVTQAEDAVCRLHNGQLALIPDCGHLPHVEQPTRCADALVGFLDHGIRQPKAKA
jgi:pimeloyl-ACP methyl ester carboxylesterase